MTSSLPLRGGEIGSRSARLLLAGFLLAALPACRAAPEPAPEQAAGETAPASTASPAELLEPPAESPPEPLGPGADAPLAEPPRSTGTTRATDSTGSVAPEVVTWGSAPDAFGEIPTADGYYSTRLHFDLDNPNPMLRALVHLERDPDGSLNLRLSREDIEKMPAVDEVLERVAGLEAGDPLDALDPLVTTFHDAFESDVVERVGEETFTLRYRMVPPIPGYDVQVLWNLNAYENEVVLRVVDTEEEKTLWQSEVIYDSIDRLEFADGSRTLFYVATDIGVGEVYSLRDGLRCSFAAVPGVGHGWLVRWPQFVDDARGLLFTRYDGTVRRLDLETCAVRELGVIDVQARVPQFRASIFDNTLSADGRRLLVGVGEADRVQLSPSGIRPARIQYLLYEIESGGLRELRRVRARILNPIDGTEGASGDSLRDPHVSITQFRSRSWTEKGLERDSYQASICFLLVQTGQGHSFALRTPKATGRGFRLDRRRGALRYADGWWDLRPLARWSGDDSDLAPEPRIP